MFSKIWSKIVSWFKQEVKTAEEIVSGYLKTIEDLEQHAVKSAEEAVKQSVVVKEAQDLYDWFKEEEQKAKSFAEKFKGLFS